MTLSFETNKPDFDAMSLFNQVSAIFKRRWRSALLLFIAIVCGVYFTLLFTTNVYDSGAQILVKLGRENTQVPITVVKGDVYSTGVQKEEIHSYMRLMTSNEIINDVIDEIGLERFAFAPEIPKNLLQRIKFGAKAMVRWGRAQINVLAIKMGLKVKLGDREKVFKLLKRNLNVVREKDSNVISVFIRLPDPYLSQDVIQKVVDVYQNYHVGLNQRKNMVKIFKAQTTADKRAINNKEKEIQALKRKWNLSYPDVQIQTLLQNIQTFKMNRDLQAMQKEELLKEGGKLRFQIKSIPETQVRAEVIEQNPTAAYMQEELAKLRVQETRTLKLYRKDSEVVGVVSDRIRDLEVLLEGVSSQHSMGKTIQPNPLYEEVFKQINRAEVDIEGLTASIVKAAEKIDTVEEEIEHLKDGQVQLNILQREFSVLETKYYANAARFEQVKIDSALDENKVANISILSQPSFSMEPAAPKKLLLMLLGTIMAVFASIGVTLLREWLSQKIYDEKDMLGMDDIPFLGCYALSQ